MFRGRLLATGRRLPVFAPQRVKDARKRAFRATPGTLRTCLAAPREARRAKRGGARRDRTDDLMLAKHALSQLSYGPVTRRRMLHSIKVVGLGRLELPTSRLSSARSNQLSYKP